MKALAGDEMRGSPNKYHSAVCVSATAAIIA